MELVAVISRSIIESDGGRLWAIANPGRVTFQFTTFTGGASQSDDITLVCLRRTGKV